MTNMRIIDRALPERTKLMFYFPSPNPQEDYYIVELPFFENVSIKERKRARYQKYSTIARSSNLYTYLGADSRQFDLSFFLTLPHLDEAHHELTKSNYIKTGIQRDETGDKIRFETPEHTGEIGVEEGIANPSVRLAYQYLDLENVESSAKQVLQFHPNLRYEEKAYIKKTYLGAGPGTTTFDEPSAAEAASIRASRREGGILAPAIIERTVISEKEKIELTQKYANIDLIVYWINVIRTSVVNNAENPLFGPPIIRLIHGIMYQDIPCLAQDYSIEWEESAGYDLQTLLPRRIKVNMKLEELRAGNFQEFKSPNSLIISRDNLAGWESVVLHEHQSMDPGYLSEITGGRGMGIR